ncbi:YihY/virulence factor BrkB family protein [Embleya sp. NBC_00888]|uniref:ribonuclease BN n=1 Tax=Embleya sp. NBC_00888 TaxID=2975960 RepID=UPI0038708A5A|nr:YihY/virulence factor BrkB family protein [Embleya sp. NBC_00888]
MPRLRGRVKDLPVMAFVGRLTTRFLVVNSIEAATTLAAKMFLAGVPALFVFAAFAPEALREELRDSLRAVLGLPAGSLDEVARVHDAGAHLRQQTGAASALFTLLMAVQVARSLQRLCRRAWFVRATGFSLRLILRWLLCMSVWLVALLLQSQFHEGFGVGPWLGVVMLLVASMLVWWWTQYLFLEGRIGWLPLLPSSLLAALGTVGVQYGSHLVMPRAVARSVAEFGPFGLMLTLMSWLVVACAVVVFAITIGAFLAEEEPLRGLLGAPAPPSNIDPPQF